MQELVSILIPVYKDGRTVVNAVKSCLEQTYPNIEVLVLNNGSPDNTASVLTELNDPKLVVIQETENIGIAPARNKLLKAAKGAYIAWLDADDVMLPERIEKQIAYMQAHPETDILGGWIKTDDPELPLKKLPLLHHEITTCLWFKNCMVQPSILSRNFYSKENIWYNETYKNAVEDYELWYRLSKVKTFANQPEFLTIYHVTREPGLGIKKRDNGFEDNLIRLWEDKWKEVPFKFDEDNKTLFREFLYSNRALNAREVQSLRTTLRRISHWRTDQVFSLITSLHCIRLWKNMNWRCKLKNLSLLRHLIRYPEMKRRFLI